MRFNQLKSKLKFFYEIFIAPPKQWRQPGKSEILIYDAAGLETMAPYLSEYKVEIISLCGESVNIPCLLRAMLKLNFWSGKPIQPYVDAYIRMVSPKVVITFIDNNTAFYSISSRFPDIKTIFLQNGMRGRAGSIFTSSVQADNYHVDYMLVFGGAFGRMYQKYISGEIIEVGSLKNNGIKKCNDVSDGSVLFLSQYRDKPENNLQFATGKDGSAISWDQFYASEIRILNFLSEWCAENNRLLRIAGCSVDQQDAEGDFYAARLKGRAWEYIPRSDVYSSYKLVDAAGIVVFIDSALGLESIGRGKKTAGFSIRGGDLHDESENFGWPAVLPDNGPFWTNNADERQFRRIMDYLNTVSAGEWEQTRQLYTSELMNFDAGNIRFIALLDQLLPQSERLNHAQ